MKKAILAASIVALVALSSFKTDVAYEQAAFNYFVSDILKSEFKEIAAIEFKGETEQTYSTLGEYKVCLKPAEKLQSIIADAAKVTTKETKPISYNQISGISITAFNKSAANPKVYVYPAMHAADNYYVFVSLQKPNEPAAKYVFELKPDANVSRSCRME